MTEQSSKSTSPVRSALSDVLAAILMFAIATAIGFVALVVLFKTGVFASIDILFYRGFVLCVTVLMLLTVGMIIAGRRTGLCSVRDAIAAGVLSFGLNLAFLIVAPVTVDRSVTVFVAGYMAAHPGQPLSVGELQTAFERRYLGEFAQIQRRMDEQMASGNVAQQGGGYVLTGQGQRFIETAKFIGWLFDADPQFVSQKPLPGLLKAVATPARR